MRSERRDNLAFFSNLIVSRSRFLVPGGRPRFFLIGWPSGVVGVALISVRSSMVFLRGRPRFFLVATELPRASLKM